MSGSDPPLYLHRKEIQQIIKGISQNVKDFKCCLIESKTKKNNLRSSPSKRNQDQGHKQNELLVHKYDYENETIMLRQIDKEYTYLYGP